MKYSLPVSVGSGPSEMANCWNRPGAIFPPDQVIWVTASVISPSSVLIGRSSRPLATSIDHPGVGCTDTDAIGWSVGRYSCTLVVSASASSLGARPSKAPYPPGSAVFGAAVAWAAAGQRPSQGTRDGHVAPR